MAAATVCVMLTEAVPAALVAVTVYEDEPGVVGVPEMIPVAGSNVSPVGRVPAVMVNVIGAVPDAVTWKLYAVDPGTDVGGALEVIVGTTPGCSSNDSV
jgi:hypothetical protein